MGSGSGEKREMRERHRQGNEKEEERKDRFCAHGDEIVDVWKQLMNTNLAK